MVRREREVDGKTSSEDAYYLTSLPANAEWIQHGARSHWTIENTLHWTLDVVLSEDASRVRSRNGATNLAALRKLTVSLLRRTTPGLERASMVQKQRIVGWAPERVFDILRGIHAE